MTTPYIRLIYGVVTLLVISMEDVQKLIYEIRLEITEYKILMFNERYKTASSVIRRIRELTDKMFELAKEKDSK